MYLIMWQHATLDTRQAEHTRSLVDFTAERQARAAEILPTDPTTWTATLLGLPTRRTDRGDVADPTRPPRSDLRSPRRTPTAARRGTLDQPFHPRLGRGDRPIDPTVGPVQIRPGSLLILDEVGMADVHTLDRLSAAATAAGARAIPSLLAGRITKWS